MQRLSGTDALSEAAVCEFYSLGYTVLPAVISACTAQFLGELIERRYWEAKSRDSGDLDLLRGDVSVMRLFEYHRAFRDILTVAPVIDLVEHILGEDCHVVAQNGLRTPTGKGIVNWHIDDALFFPFLAGDVPVALGAGVVPCYSLNAMLVLSDVEEDAFGPTQVVERSHLSGRRPEYEDTLPACVSPKSLLARAGDVYLVNSQTWHRGAQNRSKRTRYLVTTTYGCRFISQRFYPFLNYTMPRQILTDAPDRLLRLLGKHEKGPYG